MLGIEVTCHDDASMCTPYARLQSAYKILVFGEGRVRGPVAQVDPCSVHRYPYKSIFDRSANVVQWRVGQGDYGRPFGPIAIPVKVSVTVFIILAQYYDVCALLYGCLESEVLSRPTASYINLYDINHGAGTLTPAVISLERNMLLLYNSASCGPAPQSFTKCPSLPHLLQSFDLSTPLQFRDSCPSS